MATTTFTYSSQTNIQPRTMYALTGGNVPSNARVDSVSVSVSQAGGNSFNFPGMCLEGGEQNPLYFYATNSTSGTLIATFKSTINQRTMNVTRSSTINNKDGVKGKTTIYAYWDYSGTIPSFSTTASLTVTVTYTPAAAVTAASSPSGAGTVSASPSAALPGATVTMSQTPASGYYFTGWTSSPSVTFSGNTFSMPSSAITVTANYVARSTCTLSKTSMTGGETITMAIAMNRNTFSHKYTLSFGTGMATSETSVAAGVSSVSIAIPAGWSDAIPNATKKTGGTLTLKTYSGSTLIGTYTISNLTYNVPATVVPSIGTITTSVARTIGSTTYANIGNIYTQNHCGVRVQASASGARSSTIASIALSMSGYTGTSYKKTQSGGSIDFTSGLLTISGTTTITLTATDSRGRTATKTATITIAAYNKPSGSLTVKRADLAGNEDDNGDYGIYSLTKSFTAIGSNSITWSISCSQGSESSPPDTGNLLPSSRKAFSITQEYAITLTITDAFETTTITRKLPSAKFIIYVDQNGNRIGFFKATDKTAPSGKDYTFEVPASCQIYIGSETLEAYIQRIITTTQSIMLKSSVTTSQQTINTYNGRKFSDYWFITFVLRDSTSSTYIRNTVSIPTAIWTSGQVIFLEQNHGSSLENRSGIQITYDSDTSVKAFAIGSAALTAFEILGQVKPG